MRKLIRNLKQMFRSRKKDGKALHPVKTAREASPFDQLLVSLQRHCAGLSDGEATVTTGDGECHIRLRWRSDGKDRRRRRFRLDAPAGEGLWREEPLPEAGNPTGGEKTGMECPAVRRESGAEEADVKPLRQQLMLQELDQYLNLHYRFRYNLLTERTECACLDEAAAGTAYVAVDSRVLNSVALNAMCEGVECWDRDVKRYVESDRVEAYHPFSMYFGNLPSWDGHDRVTELARRISGADLWVRSFHRWMLALTAQWTGIGNEGRRANSVAPILISTAQGLGKSTFCRNLLPEELRPYFTESFDLTNAAAAENKLASYGLINLDEFDRLPASRMPQLKNLMQMEDLRVRRAYRRSAEALPRIASFIGTSNRRDLLTDLSGSRRFICVEVPAPIDCVTPIDHARLYAQLVHELRQGERCWFSKEEEAAIQEANRPFYRVTPAEEVISACFRFAEPGERGACLLPAADIYAILKKEKPDALREYTCTAFSRLLAQLGRRVHTRTGNGYWVVRV